MSIESQLRKLAEDVARDAQARASRLEREIFDLEAQTAAKKLALDAANLAPQRLANFPVKLGAYFQCPRCWIKGVTPADLLGAGEGTATSDFWRCRVCRDEIETAVIE